MKIFKKVTLIFLMIGLLVSNIPFVFASETKDKEKIVFSAEPIKDSNELYKRAKEGKTDNPKDKYLVSSKLRKIANGDSKDNVELQDKTYVTSQKVKAIENEDGSITDVYLLTAFSDILVKQEDVATIAGYTNTKQDIKTDPSVSYREQLTMYYMEKPGPYGTYVYVDSYLGRWTRLDSQVTCTSAYIRARANGQRDDGTFATNLSYTNTWTYPTSGAAYYNGKPSTWGWINTNDEGLEYQGAVINMNLKHASGSTWSYDFNITYGNFFPS